MDNTKLGPLRRLGIWHAEKEHAGQEGREGHRGGSEPGYQHEGVQYDDKGKAVPDSYKKGGKKTRIGKAKEADIEALGLKEDVINGVRSFIDADDKKMRKVIHEQVLFLEEALGIDIKGIDITDSMALKAIIDKDVVDQLRAKALEEVEKFKGAENVEGGKASVAKQILEMSDLEIMERYYKNTQGSYSVTDGVLTLNSKLLKSPGSKGFNLTLWHELAHHIDHEFGEDWTPRKFASDETSRFSGRFGIPYKYTDRVAGAWWTKSLGYSYDAVRNEYFADLVMAYVGSKKYNKPPSFGRRMGFRKLDSKEVYHMDKLVVWLQDDRNKAEAVERAKPKYTAVLLPNGDGTYEGIEVPTSKANQIGQYVLSTDNPEDVIKIFSDEKLIVRAVGVLRRIERHYGPGQHPGTGSPQIVHGRKKGESESPRLQALRRMKSGKFSPRDIEEFVDPGNLRGMAGKVVFSRTVAHGIIASITGLGDTDIDKILTRIVDKDGDVSAIDAIVYALRDSAESMKVNLDQTNRRMKGTPNRVQDTSFWKYGFEEFIEEAEENEQDLKIETLYYINDKGIPVKTVIGGVQQVEISNSDIAAHLFMQGGQMIHNHPSGRGFSVEDVQVLFFSGSDGMSAISTADFNRGSYFTVNLNPEMNLFERESLRREFTAVVSKVKPYVDQRYRSGAFDSDMAWSELYGNVFMQLEKSYPNLIDYQDDFEHLDFSKWGWDDWEDFSK